MSKIIIHNTETNEIIEREMNAEEVALLETQRQEAKNNAIEMATAKAALLEKLGITEEEAKLLLS